MDVVATSVSSPVGLRPDCLSPTEVLAQSLSTIAPTTSPTMTIPLVFALAGNGTWLAYLLAGAAVLLVALTISRFARYSAGSGSLYSFATGSLPPVASYVAGLALLLAYVATGASVTGGFINYAGVFLAPVLDVSRTANVVFGLVCTVVATAIAYRDVEVSTRLMLWIEAVSVLLIAVVLGLLVWRNGLHLDVLQLHLQHVSASGVRLGVVLALFSFVGFESATSLGAEAVQPLRTIPRAVLQSAIFCGIFFIMCAYLETAGMGAAHQNLGESTAPLRVLASLVGVPFFGELIDLGALVSMFACTLACITAAARVLLRMSNDGLIHGRFARAHAVNRTPAFGVLIVGALTSLPVVVLAARGVSGFDLYGWLGSLAVYGFITVYALAAMALPIFLRRRQELTMATVGLSVAAVIAMLLALAGTLYPVPAAPYSWLPWLYLGYLIVGTGALLFRPREVLGRLPDPRL